MKYFSLKGEEGLFYIFFKWVWGTNTQNFVSRTDWEQIAIFCLIRNQQI